jgi:hypothetical protein
MRKLFFILLIAGFGVQTVSAQTLKQFKKKAIEAFNNQNYYAALTHYSTILEVDSISNDVLYNHAEAARNYNAYTAAEGSYEKVSNSESSSEFPLTDYWLAGVKKSLGKYTEAKNLYTKYLDNSVSLNPEFMEKAKLELEYLTWAEDRINNAEEGIDVQRMGDNINTEFSESSPYEYNGKLYYSTLVMDENDKEYYPYRPSAHIFASPELGMGAESMKVDGLNSGRHAAHSSFNSAGDKIYYSKCNYVDDESLEIRCDIYVSDIDANGNYSLSRKLPDVVNSATATNTQPNIALDRITQKEKLYFVSNRIGGVGGKDIWVSTIKDDGTYSSPSLVPEINTTEDELSPFYHTGTDVLYFSSNGRKSLGGFDVYKKDISPNATNSDVEHLSYPINSSFNDIDYTINMEETKGYFASNRLGSNFIEQKREACCNDIYSVDLEPSLYDMRALTFDKLTGESLNGTTVELIEIEEMLQSDTNAETNEFGYKVRKNKEYILKATKPGYEPAEITVSTDKIDLEDVIGKLYLEPYKLNLEALAFDAETTEPLNGVTMKLVRCDELKGDSKTNAKANDFMYKNINPDDCYKLLVTKPGYVPQTVEINTDPLTGNLTLTEKIFLKKVPPVTRLTLEGYLPLPLYFDNDEPDKKSKAIVTNKDYIQTNTAYVAREDVFKRKSSKGLEGEQRIQAEYEIENFFGTKVSPAASTLVRFTDHLLRYLEQGNVAEIIIKGYASPLAKDAYNLNLTKRRISSIENHFASYKGGVFSKFIQQGFLKVTEAPYGEQLSNNGVSDNPRDRQNSIYSIPASLERRVEIIELK